MLQAARVEPGGNDVLDLPDAEVMPLLLDAIAMREIFEAPERAPAADGVLQRFAPLAVIYLVAERPHDVVLVDVELGRQPEPVAGPEHLADLGQALALPVGQAKVVVAFGRQGIVRRDREQLSGAAVDIGLPAVVEQHVDLVSDGAARNDHRHAAWTITVYTITVTVH